MVDYNTEETLRRTALNLIDGWIHYEDINDRYSDALRMCRKILFAFDPREELYADEYVWNVIREYAKAYKDANGEEFK